MLAARGEPARTCRGMARIASAPPSASKAARQYSQGNKPEPLACRRGCVHKLASFLPRTERSEVWGRGTAKRWRGPRRCNQPARHVPVRPEPELFGERPDPDGRPDPHKIRLHLVELLETARKAKTMPWPERDARMWQIAFPQMANWLPPDEADQLRFEFAQEMQRLTRAA